MKPSDYSLKRNWRGYLLVVPACIAIFLVSIYPMLYGISLAFQNYTLTKANSDDFRTFAGLKNFIEIFKQSEYIQACQNTLFWTLTNVIVQVVLAVLIALALNRKIKGRGFFRTTALIPWAVPSVIAALTFPTLGGMLGMTDHGFGLFAGTAVNDTSSVTAAASAWDGIHGSNTLEIATIVKLTRTLAIIPITLVLALWRTHKAKTEQSRGGEAFSLKRAFPMFILYFVLASIITTVCTTVGVPAGVFTPLKTLSKFFIVMAMAAIGMNTNIVKLVKTGGKPIFMGFCCWVAIACVSIAMQHLLGFL